MLKKIILSSMILGLSAYADSFSININNDTLNLEGDINLNKFYTLNENSDYLMSIAYLSSDKDNTDVSLLSFGLKALNPYVNDYGISFGLGIKILGLDFDNTNNTFVAVPLNIFAKYQLNESIHVNGYFDYAPSVLSLSDAKSFQAWSLNINYEVINQGFVYTGIRNIKAKYDKAPIENKLNDNIYFGFKVIF